MTRRPPRPETAIDERLAPDLAALHAALAASPKRTPCLDPATGPDWIAENHAAQQRAARACATCPVLSACRSYGLTHPTEHGVYGGTTTADRTTRTTCKRGHPLASTNVYITPRGYRECRTCRARPARPDEQAASGDR